MKSLYNFPEFKSNKVLYYLPKMFSCKTTQFYSLLWLYLKDLESKKPSNEAFKHKKVLKTRYNFYMNISMGLSVGGLRSSGEAFKRTYVKTPFMAAGNYWRKIIHIHVLVKALRIGPWQKLFHRFTYMSISFAFEGL